MRPIRPAFLIAAAVVLSACSSTTTSTDTSGTSAGSTEGSTTTAGDSASAGTSSGGSTGASSAASTGTGSAAGSSTGSGTGSATGAAGSSTGGTTGTASTRVAWIPDYYGQTVNVLAGANTDPVTLQLPSTCTPNSVVVNGGKLYVACSADSGAKTSDEILVYGTAAVSALVAGTPGTSSSPAPKKTITDANFNSLIGMTFDSLGDLWVASYGNSEVLEITATSLASANPASTVNLQDSPSSPVALAFDSDGSLWVTGQYSGGILLNFTADQQTLGEAASPRYCMLATDQAGCQTAPFLGTEGLALFNGDVWVANNDTGASGQTPGREIFDIRVVNGALSLIATYGSSSMASLSPIVCPGGLFATPSHLWVNDESYGETTPQCGANGDVAAATGGIFDFTLAQLGNLASQAPIYTGVTGRPGFGGIFIQKDD